ncbi:MAG TPA: LapA family protein [Gammaproteobacteria bacterium]|nr:LapA family protein [Gammaproteobacteria bacterium]
MSQLLKRIIYTSLFIIVLLAGVLFFARNNHPVSLDYVLGNVEWPVSVVLFTSLFAGAVLGVLATIPMILRLKHQNSKLQRQVKVSEKEINNLRILPAKQSH